MVRKLCPFSRSQTSNFDLFLQHDALSLSGCWAAALSLVRHVIINNQYRPVHGAARTFLDIVLSTFKIG